MNWTGIADDWHGPTAVCSLGASPVDPRLAFTVIGAACAPFARGLRHRAIPAIVFEADADRIPVPGDLLPGDGDADADAYRERLAGRAGEWRLRVIEPLYTDFRLWNQVRTMLDPLWARVGLPVMPVASELILAGDGTTACGADRARTRLLLVCEGTAELRTGTGSRRLAAGDVVRLPPGDAGEVRAGASCLLLCLHVPVDRRAPTAAALGVFTEVIAADAAGEAVPYLRFPPEVDGDELILGPFGSERPPHHEDFRVGAGHLTGVWWAGRASAAGLDPAPDPGDPPPLEPGVPVRLSSPVVDLPGDEAGQRRWAVNGIAFTVAGPVPGQVLDRLRTGAIHRAEELCLDADGDDNGAAPLLDRLHALRALEIVEEDA